MILERCGLGPRPGERTLWVCCGEMLPSSAAAYVLAELRKAFPRFQLLFSSPAAGVRRSLAGLYRSSLVRPPPFETRAAAALFLARLRVAGVVCFEGEGEVGPVARAAALRRGLPVLSVDPGALTLADVEEELRRDPKLRIRVDTGSGARRLLGWRARRLESLDELRSALGHPQTILCLGNGPSSEDPELDGMQYDCLFRVNWEWKHSSRLVDPDMVFTGNARTVRELPRAIAGFQTLAAEQRVLRRGIAWRLLRPLRYVTLERLPTVLGEREWPAKPTNGVAMVALAAALAPRRLVVAGIDLYAHPEGGYAWESDRANAYHAPHDRDVELDIIERALETFAGDVEIVGEVLRSSLEQRRQAASAAQEDG